MAVQQHHVVVAKYRQICQKKDSLIGDTVAILTALGIIETAPYLSWPLGQSQA